MINTDTFNYQQQLDTQDSAVGTQTAVLLPGAEPTEPASGPAESDNTWLWVGGIAAVVLLILVAK